MIPPHNNAASFRRLMVDLFMLFLLITIAVSAKSLPKGAGVTVSFKCKCRLSLRSSLIMRFVASFPAVSLSRDNWIVLICGLRTRKQLRAAEETPPSESLCPSQPVCPV